MNNGNFSAANARQAIGADQQLASGRGGRLEVNSEAVADRTPKVWEQLRTLFSRYVQEFNAENNPQRRLRCDVLGAYLFVIRPDKLPEIITADYEPSTSLISIRIDGTTEKYRVAKAGLRETELALVSSARPETPLELRQIVKSSLQRGILPVYAALRLR